MLGFGWPLVVVLEENFINVAVHCEPAGAFGVVPVQVYTCKFGSGPVRGDLVIFLECKEEMVSVLSSGTAGYVAGRGGIGKGFPHVTV